MRSIYAHDDRNRRDDLYNHDLGWSNVYCSTNHPATSGTSLVSPGKSSTAFCHLRGLRLYEDRFATELAEKPDGGWARVKTPKHLSLDGYNAWKFALKVVVNELLQLPSIMNLHATVLRSLELNSEALELERNFGGRSYAHSICTVHRDIALFRQFKGARRPLKKLLLAAVTGALITRDGDVLGQLWSVIRNHGASRGALKSYLKLDDKSLDALKNPHRGHDTIFSQVKSMQLISALPVKLSGEGLEVIMQMVAYMALFSPSSVFPKHAVDKTLFLPFLRMLAREVLARETLNALAAGNRSLSR